MPILTVGKYLKRWGYTPQRPTRQALEESPRTCSAGCSRPLIELKRPSRKAASSTGPMSVALDGHCVRSYAPVGHVPVLTVTSKRFSLTMVLAVSSKGLEPFEFLEGAATDETTMGFMKRIAHNNEGHKMFLILDNLSAHHAKVVSAWVQPRKSESEVFYLPPYTPQSNPDEYRNRNVKTQLRDANNCTTQFVCWRRI